MLTIDYDRFRIRAGERVLDLGCGGGRHSFEALRRNATVVSVDIASDELEGVAAMARAMAAEGQVRRPPPLSCVQGDALRLPFKTGTFDRVIASEVLEHITDDPRAFREIARVLRAGGALAVSVPRYWPERVCWMLSRAYHSNDGGHVRIYTFGELSSKAAQQGLELVTSHHAHALHSPYWWLKCIAGVSNEKSLGPRLYRRLLEWQIGARPKVLDGLERALNPLMGKSLVAYFEKATGPRVET